MADEIAVTRVAIEPNRCPIDAPLHIHVAFTTPKMLQGAKWVVKVRAAQLRSSSSREAVRAVDACCCGCGAQYTVDAAAKRHVIEVGGTETRDYAPGSHELDFKVRRAAATAAAASPCTVCCSTASCSLTHPCPRALCLVAWLIDCVRRTAWTCPV